jgi:hypothetical protein
VIQRGDLVWFVTPTFVVDKGTVGIVTGHHPTDGKVGVLWIATDLSGPSLRGYWSYGSLKVISRSPKHRAI